MKEAFVTGGTGFLGAHLISRLLQAGYQVDAIYRNPSKLTDFEAMARTYLLQPAQKEALRWHKADVRDSASLQELIHSEHQVFHAAGMVSFDEKKAHRMYETNVLGTAAMVDVCLYKGVKHFCHVSSTAAVGKTSSEHELILEDTPWNRDQRHSAYARTKYKAELEVWRGLEEGLKACMVNPGVILGTGNWNFGTCRLFRLVHKGLKVYSPGLNGFIGVEDVCNEMIVLSEKGISGERFILVSENLNFEEVLQEIARQLGVKGPQLGLSKGVIHLAGRIGSALRKIGIPVPITRDYANSSVARHAYSSEKARQLTGSQYMPMKEVIQQVAEQYLQSQR